jgi:branched-chain amino acid transport system substrate-binding protein
LLGVIDMALAQTPAPTTVTILSADDPFSVEVADSAKTYAQNKGLKLVYYQKYPSNSTDLRAPLTEAKGKNADLFLNSGHFAESVAIIQQAKELDFLAKAYAFSVGPSLPNFQTTLKANANYVVDGTQWTADLNYNGVDLFKSPQAYHQMYVARWGHGPPYQSANATVSGIAFVQALQAAETIDPHAVRDQIAKLDIMTFYGQVKFDSRGVNIYKPMVVEQWQNGQKVTIWPPDVANGKPFWPAPVWDKR